MSDYKEIKGKTIQYLGTDPSDTGAEGQVWYNSAAGAFKSVVIGAAWSSGGNLSTGRYVASALGTQTAAVITGGSTPSYTNAVEEYNGTGFTTATNYPINITNSGRAGTQTAGLVAGGNAPPFTTTSNEYDGSSWTATGSLPTAADNIGSCGTGTQSNVIMTLGRIPSTINAGNNTTATYNGSTFSAGPNINTARLFAQSSAGTGTAGLIYGGFIDPSPNAMTNTEEYNGTAWTAANALNRASGLNTGWGTQTSAIAQVNAPGYKGAEQYDGTSWTNISDMTLADNGANYSTAAGATADAGFITSRGPAFSATEEFNKSINVITGAAWASGGNLPQAEFTQAGAGVKTAALVFGGRTPPTVDRAETFEYDGSSWSSGGNLGQARRVIGGCGTQTAALASGGHYGSPQTEYRVAEEYNGSTWTNGGTFNSPLHGNSGTTGTQTAAVTAGGYPNNTSVENYDGSTWTSVTTIPLGRSLTAMGSQTAAIFAGGYATTNVTNVDEYDGTTISSGTNLPTARSDFGSSQSAPSTNGIIFGGVTPVNNTTVVLNYDGTTWSTYPSISTGRYSGGGSGGLNTAFYAGGYTTTAVATTEEFTGETSALNIKTLTTS